MTDPRVHLTLDRTVVTAGGAVRARMIWQHDAPPAGVRIELGWTTEGRGDTDGAVVHRHAVGPEHGPIPLHVEAVLPVPQTGPVSYDGRLIRVRWWVRGIIDLRRARDPVSEIALQVVPAVRTT